MKTIVYIYITLVDTKWFGFLNKSVVENSICGQEIKVINKTQS